MEQLIAANEELAKLRSEQDKLNAEALRIERVCVYDRATTSCKRVRPPP
jgi:hypothetical protein